MGSKGAAVERALASNKCGPGLNLGGRRRMWVAFVVISLK